MVRDAEGTARTIVLGLIPTINWLSKSFWASDPQHGRNPNSRDPVCKWFFAFYGLFGFIGRPAVVRRPRVITPWRIVGVLAVPPGKSTAVSQINFGRM